MRKEPYCILYEPMPSWAENAVNGIALDAGFLAGKKIDDKNINEFYQYIARLPTHPDYFVYRFSSVLKKWILEKEIRKT